MKNTGSKNTRRKFLTAAALPTLALATPLEANAQGGAPLDAPLFQKAHRNTATAVQP